MPPNVTDIELIRNLQKGDQTALYALYEKYSGAIYGVILRICKQEDVAEDILQEAFVKIWRKIDQYDSDKGKFYTWAYRIAKNTALNSIRKNKTLIQTEDLSVYIDKEADVRAETYPELNGMLRKLDAHHLEAIELVYFKGYTHREAHKEMEVPLGTFKSYIKQALRKLRENYPSLLVVLFAVIEIVLNG